MRRSYLKRTGRLKPGRRVKAWNSARRKLKVLFAKAGILRCELRLEGCMGDDGLGFAHKLKRRNIKGDQIMDCALLCNWCHWQAEKGGEASMAPIIEGIISNREVSV